MPAAGASELLTVVHSTRTWLPLTETWLYHQVVHLPPEVESHIVCERTENLDQFPMPRVHALDRSPLRYAWERTLRKLWVRHHLGFLVDVARRTHARLLHSHFGNVGWADLGAARRADLRHVVTFYGRDAGYLPAKNPRYRARYRELFAAADRILCEGPHMAGCIVALGCPESKVQVHRLGVRVHDIAFHPRTWKPGTPLRVLIAASFSEKKGIPYALEALALVSREIPVEITIIGDSGGGVLTTEKKRILGTLERTGLAPRTRLLGFQPHRVFFEEAYRHHAYLAPSLTSDEGDTEGGAPVSIIEMAATGMPVVSTTHCDIPQVLQHGVSGLLAAERDPQGLAAHLRWLAANPGAWAGMAARARRHIESEFDARTQGRRLFEIYQDVLSVSKKAEQGREKA
jgi:colanic acid/amylovoran biosynthesis glycosyltransferase